MPDLDRMDVRRQVEERLKACGYQLAVSAYSDHVGVRLSHEGTRDFDAASNIGLGQDHLALITLCWARLLLQKRTHKAGTEPEAAPKIYLNTIASEFRHMLGGKAHIRSLVGRLRNLGFLAGQGDLIEAGPFLELGIDGAKMVPYYEIEVLKNFIPADSKDPLLQEGNQDDPFLETILLEMKKLGGQNVRMMDLRLATKKRPATIRKYLHVLEEKRLISHTGTRSKARYHVKG